MTSTALFSGLAAQFATATLLGRSENDTIRGGDIIATRLDDGGAENPCPVPGRDWNKSGRAYSVGA